MDPEPELPVQAGTSNLARAPRFIGVIPYEARRGIERDPGPDPRPAPRLLTPRWLRYGAVAEIGDRVRVIGDDSERVAELAHRIARSSSSADEATLCLVEPIEPAELHRDRIQTALEHIAKGDVYVINLARLFRFSTKADPLALLEKLSRKAPAPFRAALRLGTTSVVSTSPELLLRTTTDGRALTKPIKGTRPRGRDAVSDLAMRCELELDPKERAELAMVVDVERNDLGRVARAGSVRQLFEPRVQTHRTLHHRSVELTADLAPNADRTALLEAMLPSGSVTGAPKIRAMELIRELEADRRGLYTGGIGFVRHDGTLELSMAIRTLIVDDEEGHYFAGGGIVADSDPLREVEETLWKAFQVLG